MPSTHLRRALAVGLIASLTLAFGQAEVERDSVPGLQLGYVATIDAPLLDPPTDANGRVEVAVRGPSDEDVARLILAFGSADGARLQGTLRLQGILPDLRGSPLLARIDDEELWPCPMTVSADAGFLPVAFRASAAGAMIDIANRRLPANPESGYRQLVLVFADADVHVRGACHEAPQALSVEVYLRPGWNLLVSEVVEIGGELLVLLRSAAVTDLPDAGWYWRELGDARPVETVPRRN
jgi:hypothetical protein